MAGGFLFPEERNASFSYCFVLSALGAGLDRQDYRDAKEYKAKINPEITQDVLEGRLRVDQSTRAFPQEYPADQSQKKPMKPLRVLGIGFCFLL